MDRATTEQTALLAALPDEYLAEREADVRDVGERLLASSSREQYELPMLEVPSIVVASDLTPSQIARLPKDRLLGMVMEIGGHFSCGYYGSVVGIPAVIGIEGLLCVYKTVMLWLWMDLLGSVDRARSQ